MSVKNITFHDLALVELLRDGRTDAPPSLISTLVRRGHVKTAAGKLSLTAAGRSRARRLSRVKDLQRMFAMKGTGGVYQLTTDGGGSMVHIGDGGPAHIRG
jgi:hypothetical protein